MFVCFTFEIFGIYSMVSNFVSMGFVLCANVHVSASECAYYALSLVLFDSLLGPFVLF